LNFIFSYFKVIYLNKYLFINIFNNQSTKIVVSLFLVFFIDALLIDDEPLWEPIEWSLVQTWLFFIFFFAWVGENLITSRYGSYTGRDKRVWLAWYKSFWLIEFWYVISFGAAILFVIIPFYHEITYNTTLIISWWYWFSRFFFFKTIATLSLLIYINYIAQISLRWFSWKKIFLLFFFNSLILAFFLYTTFIMAFFAYFTDPVWYQKTRTIDYIQLSHEPLKWGWGSEKKDHFLYHHTPTVFWFKNDGPFASAMLLIHLTLFIVVFFTYLYWLVLLRRSYTFKEVSFTYTTYAISSIKQFLYFFLFLYVFIIFSFIINYWRYPIEFLWTITTASWVRTFFSA
jgi:hypothetical protein